MCIETISQLNVGALLKAGGTATISSTLVEMLKRQRRSTLDTDKYLYREGDGFEYRISLCGKSPRATLIRGVLLNSNNSVLCYIDQVAMKGYQVKEVVTFGEETFIDLSNKGRLFRNLRDLSAITKMYF
ncbi:hypothetical protein D3C85_98340 [compost metagenome]